MYKLVTINGKEYKFRITNKSQKEIEKKIGPLLNAVDRVGEAEIFAVIVWGALFPLNAGISLEDVDDIIDHMVDEGIIDSIENRIDFVMELLQGAGFFSKDLLKRMKEAREKAKLEEMKKASLS